ncbi:AraC-like DNA-binding protein [Spinactinospora alkalitolerans]|uniref:AraC-like DNA-binding protein n=1 Tax=Spinactinospora alkalitolerans TaxID=687207 RepID=A0A852TW76_9ACTN|nr:helix-turn-helix transcriptional regulator [Spinactinospora alkalitolerans]NYE47112.1 AraC-like DNA-binding protein [Spinactinospora alkalitolerans]
MAATSRSVGSQVAGPALRLPHANPAHPWTVAAPTAESGVSRASLARRFSALVGQPPMAYLREWRLTLAADLLCEPGATVGAVAGRVGFANAFTLSTAFKRERGISPREYRTATPAHGTSVRTPGGREAHEHGEHDRAPASRPQAADESP